MTPTEVIEFPHATIEVQIRAGYLFVIESGSLTSITDVQRYCTAMDRLIARTEITRAIVDARGEVGDPPAPVRAAMWQWLISEDRGFDALAFVLPTEMAVARVNMTALAKGARLRAFETIVSAQRWLLRGPRFATRPTMPSQPAAESGEVEVERRPPRESAMHSKLRPGQYRSSDAPVDRIGASKKKRGGFEVA